MSETIDADELPTFDLVGPLPTGTTLLEASAGTGKTFTVGALVTRYVAEGQATLDEMLVITFSRSATQELRTRVRDQLTSAERAVARQLATGDAAADNELLVHLLDADPAELARRLERLRDALAAFDSATIATTHQFCHVVLRSLGVAGESDIVRHPRRVPRRARARGRRRPLPRRPRSLHDARRSSTARPRP